MNKKEEEFQNETGWSLSKIDDNKVVANYKEEMGLDKSYYWSYYAEWLERELEEKDEEILFARSFIRSKHLSNECAEFEKEWKSNP